MTTTMQLGMIGLGRMGSNIVRRLMRDGHSCSVYDLNSDAVATLAADGATGASSVEELVASLTAPRQVWVMVPAGGATDHVISALAEHLEPGDTIIDGGNSYYRDDLRRSASSPRAESTSSTAARAAACGVSIAATAS